ncbi:MAG: glutamine--fructose-6-phosphate transaminase (isomerizing) [Candidatus Altiarchaeales archaeon ex4484_96]|nr:MAG: glutamine--fructose-6-phosphate transaminase (isomerizing) [Candidatus Altiarchaeales archaeon ex4484_96]
MCGIAGYIGPRQNTSEILFNMIKRLEYRGYDSAGIACVTDDVLCISKDKGKISELEDKINSDVVSDIGIAHTRWATHGAPSQLNAHPHTDCQQRFCVVHNGIIENHRELRDELIKKGHSFTSETDTEVIPHLIEEHYVDSFEQAFTHAVKRLRGSFALAALSVEDKNRILIARKDSPLIIGLGDNEYFIASDTPALIPHTRDVIILDDFNYAVLSREGVRVCDIQSGGEVTKEVLRIDWDQKQAEKEGFKHFMLKEIFEEPDAIRNAYKANEVLAEIAGRLAKYSRYYLVGCGTAYYAALAAKYLLERFGISSEAVLGSEYRYSTINCIDKDCAVVAVSQSGETADTLVSAKESKNKGAYLVGLVNVLGSSLTRVVDDVSYIYAGPEIAVASTKAYIGQVTSLIILSLYLAREKNKISEQYLREMLDNINSVPDKIGDVLSEEDKIKKLADEYSNKEIFFFIGRKQNYPTALEGALKLKEISYVHAEAYPAGELKHGPLALLEEGVPVIALMPNDELIEKIESNVAEAQARKALVLRVSEQGEMRVPVVDPLLSPLLYITPLHLFAYHICLARGLDPDKPRNLAKSVTVE